MSLLDAGLVPLPGEEEGYIVIKEEDWLELEKEERKLFNRLQLHANMQISRDEDFGRGVTVFRWRYQTPCITTLR